jgi:hypothetical protein
VFLHSFEDFEEFCSIEFILYFFVVVKNLLQRVRDTPNCFIVVRERNDEGEGFNDGKRVEELVGRRIVEKNIVDGRSDPKSVV